MEFGYFYAMIILFLSLLLFVTGLSHSEGTTSLANMAVLVIFRSSLKVCVTPALTYEGLARPLGVWRGEEGCL